MMAPHLRKIAVVPIVLLLFIFAAMASAQTPVPTYEYNNARMGADTAETILTPANVNKNSFGKLFSLPVNGLIFAQPLYVPNLPIPGLGTHNVIYVATQHNTLYAFDADNGATLWSASLGSFQSMSGCTPEYDMGVMGTPVIAPASKTIYVAALALLNGNPAYQLHALDITSGTERPASPVTVTASVAGMGYGSVNGQLTFSPMNQRQRTALLLDNGIVYVGFASNCDDAFVAFGHGWLFGYGATTLKLRSLFVSSANGYGSGIWQSGGGPAADANHYKYLSTANGTFDVNQGGNDYGDTVLKLAPNGSAVLDYFTPFNEATLEATDFDLGSGGITLLPDQATSPKHLMITGGKQGRIYLINRDNLGHFHSSADSVVQEWPGTRRLFSTITFWNNRLYFAEAGDTLRAFSFVGGRMSKNPTSQTLAKFPFPGSGAVVSANGTSNGRVWVEQHGGTASHNEVLHAYDATNLANELYNSDQAGTRDLPGIVGKPFESILVANGRVYVPSGQPQITVFGLLPH